MQNLHLTYSLTFREKYSIAKGSETASVHIYVVSSIFISLSNKIKKPNKTTQNLQQQTPTDLKPSKLAHPHSMFDYK